MNDRELLEFAAKAADMPKGAVMGSGDYLYEKGSVAIYWSPLNDDGDAMRLAVKLNIAIVPYPIYEQPKHSVIAKQYKDSRAIYRGEPTNSIEEIELYNDDPHSATRRAIVRAAAEIGKAME